jgi:type VI secretion system protein VasG
VRHYELDSGAGRRPDASLDRLPRGASSISDISQFIDSAVERGWVYGSLMFGERRCAPATCWSAC